MPPLILRAAVQRSWPISLPVYSYVSSRRCRHSGEIINFSFCFLWAFLFSFSFSSSRCSSCLSLYFVFFLSLFCFFLFSELVVNNVLGRVHIVANTAGASFCICLLSRYVLVAHRLFLGCSRYVLLFSRRLEKRKLSIRIGGGGGRARWTGACILLDEGRQR